MVNVIDHEVNRGDELASRTKDGDFKRSFEAKKSASVGQLLFKAARLFNEEAVERVAARGAVKLRTSHTLLFPHLDVEKGIRATVLADRLGITKQAVSKLLKELESSGVVERVRDPADARAQLVRITAAGRQGMLDGLEELKRLEAELAGEIGILRMADLHEGLAAMLAALEARQNEDQ